MALTALQFVAFIDKMTAASLAAIGTSGSGYGDGDRSLAQSADYGVSRKVRDALSIQLGWGDYDINNAMSRSVHDMQNSANYQTDLRTRFGPALSALSTACAAAGLAFPSAAKVSTIQDFATYFNTSTGGPFNALLPPDFGTLYAYGQGLSNTDPPAAGNLPLPTNVYSPVIPTMFTYAVTGAGTGTPTAGTAVDTTKYAGAAVSTATMTGFAGASDTVTVTGTALTAAGASTAGRTFTVAIGANGKYDLVPTVTGDILQSVSAVAAGNNITGGTIVIAGDLPYYISNMGQATVTGAGTVGALSSINSAPNWTPAADVIATGLAGTGIVTVTGNAVTNNGAGVLVVNRAFTVNVTANGKFLLVPTVGGDMLQTVTGISVVAGITAGVIKVAGVRQNPPV